MHIKVSVFKFNRMASKDVVFSTSLDVPDGIVFPFDRVNDVLRLLFPKSEGVDFCIV